MLRVTATSRGIATVELNSSRGAVWFDAAHHRCCAPASSLQDCVQELKEYFEGKRKQFTVPLDLEGTQFQKNVWKRLLAVRFGETLTYGQIAKAIGKPRAVRAVGTALKNNPIAVIVPCHRVLPTSRETGNYAWGKARKKWLLRHEECHGERSEP